MDPFGWKSVAIAGAVCSLMATRAVRKRSLTPGGAAAGFLTGFLLISCGLRGLVLLVFYQCGSWATKYQLSLKMRRDATLQSHAQRGATQVLCVSGLACLLQLWHAAAVGAELPYNADNHALATRLACAVTAHHATGLADTLASELGILASSAANSAPTVLVTAPWRRVPPGTNGGVTLAGFGWSLVGGAVIGVSTVLLDALSGLQPERYAVVLVAYGAVSGLLGSLVDSVLGATLQATYYDKDTKLVYHHNSAQRLATVQLVCGRHLLTNEQVNLVSTAVTVYLGGWLLGPWMFAVFADGE